MTAEKFNSIERALIAASKMDAHRSREIVRLICEGGMTTTVKVEQPTPGQVHYAKREKLIKRTKSAVDRVIDYAKHETLRKIEKHFRSALSAARGGQCGPDGEKIVPSHSRKIPDESQGGQNLRIDLAAQTSLSAAEGDEAKTLAEQLAFDKQRSADELAATLREEATVALSTAGQQLFDEVGADNVWETPTADALSYLDSRENLFANASDEIHGEVMQQIQTGLESGETKKELMARISTAFDGIKQTRADTIANTETAAAFNFSRDKAMREAGVTHKKWLLSHSPLIKEHRITHVENDGQTVPLDDPFDIGGVKFMYPSDDSLGAGPEDIINCHCVSIPVEAP